LSTVIHVAHAVLAEAWLGGVIFTTAVVSPALKAMKCSGEKFRGARLRPTIARGCTDHPTNKGL
jgi:putative copper export protein